MKTLIILLFTLGLCATAGGNVVDSLRDTGTRYSYSGEVFHFGNQITIPLAVRDSVGNWSFPQTDSLTARLERVEKQVNGDRWGMVLGMLVLSLFIVLEIFANVKHERKRITEAHR